MLRQHLHFSGEIALFKRKAGNILFLSLSTDPMKTRDHSIYVQISQNCIGNIETTTDTVLTFTFEDGDKKNAGTC